MDDPLKPLADALRDGATIPFDWIVEHARDGTIRAVWDACKDAQLLLQVYAYAGDRPGLVRAACACARTALKGEDRPRIAIETAEAWTRGEATLDQVRKAAADAAYAADADYAAADYAASAAYTAHTAHAAAAAAYAANAAARGHALAKLARGHALAKLAKLVRATVPCPTLAQLMVR